MREHQRARMRVRVPLPAGKYRVLYADPPWFYGNHGIINESDGYGRAARHYPPMTIAELCALDVAGLVAENAVLFLWVTSPLLKDSFKVVEAWGFDYKDVADLGQGRSQLRALRQRAPRTPVALHARQLPPRSSDADAWQRAVDSAVDRP